MTEIQYKNDIIKKMKAVGTYNDAYQHSIKALAKVLRDYEVTTDKFDSLKMPIVLPYTNKNGSKNLVKNPMYLAIEKMRDDILAYSRELGLTPAGLKRITSDGNVGQKDNVSKLEKALMMYENE